MEGKRREFDRYYAEYGEYVEETLGRLTGGDHEKILLLSEKVWTAFYKEMKNLAEQGEDGIRAWLYVMARCRSRGSDVPGPVITGLLFEEHTAALTEAERIRMLCEICGLPPQEAEPDSGGIFAERSEEMPGME